MTQSSTSSLPSLTWMSGSPRITTVGLITTTETSLQSTIENGLIKSCKYPRIQSNPTSIRGLINAMFFYNFSSLVSLQTKIFEFQFIPAPVLTGYIIVTHH